MKKFLFFILLLPFLAQAQITITGSPTMLTTGAYTCGPGTTPVYNFDGTYSLYTEGGNPVPYNGKPLYVKSICSFGDCFVMYNNNGICGAGGTLFIRWNATWNYWELVLRVQTNYNYYEFVQITPLDAATPTPPCGTTSGVLTPFNQMVVSGASCTNYCTSYVTINGSTEICPGQSTTLTASGCSGLVTWSNGTTGNTVTVSSSGVIMAGCNVEGVCPSSKTITINSDTPTPKLNSGNQTICNGGSFELTASGCTGSLVWNNGATNSSITVTTNGTYSATCTLNGCSKTSTFARFTFAPSITISGSNCFPTTLTASGQGNYPIQWMRSEEKIPGATNSTYSPTINGSYQVALISNDSKWTVTGAPNFSFPYDMYFTDADNGMLLNQYNFLKTTDGGKNWNYVANNDNNNLRGFEFINATTGFAVGNAGVIMKTTDAGVTWTNVTSPTTDDLRYIQFVDANNGFIMGQSKVTLKTTNGGATWAIVSTADGSLGYYGVYNMVFVNSTTGFAAGKSDGGYLRLWKTTNAGSTWTETIATRTVPGYPKISMVDANTGWLYNGTGELLKTTNGGATWVNQPFFETLSNAFFINANQGWIQTTDNNSSEKKFYYTTDGGTTWTKEAISAGGNSWGLATDFFAFANAAFYTGTISYSSSTVPALVIREKQTCLSETKTVVIATRPSITITNNNPTICSGTSVTLSASGCNSSPAVWLTPSTTGSSIVVAPTVTTTYEAKCVESGCDSPTNPFTVIVHTSPTISGNTCAGSTLTATGFGSTSIQWLKDGVEIAGATSSTYTPTESGNYQVATIATNGAWTSLTSPSAKSINGVYFVNANLGWIVGDNGTIYNTSNGGTSWTQQTSNITSHLNAVYFINANTGIAVGDSGKIVRTINGGTTWAKVTSNTVNQLNDVFFLDANTGWAVGGQYSVLKTTNGGASWSIISTDNTKTNADAYTKVQFLDANTGYVSGGSADFTQGFVRKSTNGGTTWAASYISNYANGGVYMYALSYVSINIGWAGGIIAGGAPFIVKTTDSGTNWTGLTSLGQYNTNPIRSMHFIDANRGWIMFTNSSGGYSMRSTADGGATLAIEPTTNSTFITSYAIGKKVFMLPDGKTGWMVGYSPFGGNGYLMKFAPNKVCTSNTIVVNAKPAAPTLNITGTQTLCPNTSISLIASACSGTINWSTGASGSTLTVSAQGTYSATCTNPCGTSLASAQLIVTSIPASLTLTGSATDGLKQAGETIVSTQTISSTNNTNYKAGKGIVLDTAFQTQTGAIFVAEIGGCN